MSIKENESRTLVEREFVYSKYLPSGCVNSGLGLIKVKMFQIKYRRFACADEFFVDEVFASPIAQKKTISHSGK
jgi:hypothetical protein